MDDYKVIGVMSGTSLDGIDLSYCEFTFDTSWQYKILNAETIPYPSHWVNLLTNLSKLSLSDIEKENIKYGEYIGFLVKEFARKYKLSPDFISSHGHTIFHQPEKGITLQIGDGRAIADATGLPVVYDFRTLDVQLGGQGAPLVPVGDKLLFGDYSECLNLGGIANISYESKSKRIAFDICPVNMVLNHYSKKAGHHFDKDGALARSGRLNKNLLNQLNTLDYYQQPPPKSLGREWTEHFIFPLIEDYNIAITDILRTYTEHIVYQIKNIATSRNNDKILITGGGAWNKFLIERFREGATYDAVVPDKMLVDYKEALVFAFLGVLRWRNEINCLSSVTGASRDSCSGQIVK